MGLYTTATTRFLVIQSTNVSELHGKVDEYLDKSKRTERPGVTG